MAGKIYSKPIVFTLMVTVAVLAGSIVMMAYPMMRPEMHPKLENLRPFTALQLAGRDVYQREGCVNCHTQTVRPLRTEVMRYGEYSKAGEFAYDRPFLWGSKRTGPDLAREGGKRPDSWHQAHYENPQAVVPRSNMPGYGWMKAEQARPRLGEGPHGRRSGCPTRPSRSPSSPPAPRWTRSSPTPSSWGTRSRRRRRPAASTWRP